jgi:hypothetical protein
LGGPGLIGILTTDVRLYYDLIDLLKKKHIPFRMLNFDEPVPKDIGVVLTSEGELADIDFEPKIAVVDIETGVRHARLALRGLSSKETIIVSVDPGPKPGIAVLCAGQIIETRLTHSPEEAADRIIEILDDYKFERSVLKMGHGSPEHRDEMLAHLTNYFSQVEIIDETRTSTKSKSPHEDAAVAIARHRRRMA